ncbi:MAG TPA: trypsin-like peptidase domain-containing protein [Gammaproteobacteria bacterium]|nr:trypsin-like peptidase domain-containing protein [Gammaproteobacteria bacterium]
MQIPVRFLWFLLRAVVVGLAVAFLVVWFRPGLLVAGQSRTGAAADSYARAVTISSASVVNVHSARRVRQSPNPLADDPFWQRYFGNQSGAPQNRLESSLGSGVIVSGDGYVLTNYHVISGADAIQVGLQDGRSAAAHIVGVDPDTDLALLKIDLPHLKAIELGRSDDLHVGDVVLAIGDPYGVGQTVTQGIVSAMGRSQLGLSTFENFIQTDAAINPGNSGGALVNAGGQLVGINTALFSTTGGSTGIGFAIPVNLARGVMKQIIAYGRVKRGYLGVEPQDITPDLAKAFKLDDTHGFLVTSLAPNGPGARAGLLPGDAVISIDDSPILNSRDALNQIASHTPGSVITLGVVRHGRKLGMKVTIAERPVQRSS